MAAVWPAGPEPMMTTLLCILRVCCRVVKAECEVVLLAELAASERSGALLFAGL